MTNKACKTLDNALSVLTAFSVIIGLAKWACKC